MPGGAVSTSTALTAVLIEGLIFIILTITNVREAIVNAIPASLRNAIGAGIGLFIAFIGLILTGFLYVKKVPGAILLGIIISMPLTYSISNGILIGMISYVLMNMNCGNFKKITPVMYILAVLFILK